jgi:hypothetical protein
MNQLWIQLGELFVVQAQLGPCRGTEVLEENIRCAEELEQDSTSHFIAQIESEALFISVKRAKARAVAFVFRISPAVGVAAVGQLNLDHFAAKIAEQATSVGTRHMAANLNANSSFESAENHGMCNRF